MTKQEKAILVLLAILNFTHILDFMIMMPLGNYLMPFFKITPKQFSFLVASYTFAASVSGFAAVFFVDSFDRKKLLIAAYSGFLLATLACGLAPTYMFLLLARIVAGLFGGLIGAQVISIISDIFSYERRGGAMGAVMAAFAVASTLGIPLGLYLANAISWHAPFIFIACMGAVLVPFLLHYLPAMNAHLHTGDKKKISFDGFLGVLKDKQQYSALVFSCLIMFAHFVIIPFINPYMEFNLGYSKKQTPLIYLVGGIAAFFASTLLGKLSDKMGKLKIFTICLIISLPLMLGITNLIALPYAIVLTLFGLWFAVATGRGVTSQAMISTVVKSEHRGSFQSFNSSVQQLGTGIAALVAGMVVTKNKNESINNYAILGIIAVVAMIITLVIARNIFKDTDKRIAAK
jgi:MFS transporter, DHA1 family, inner membrane transport protein